MLIQNINTFKNPFSPLVASQHFGHASRSSDKWIFVVSAGISFFVAILRHTPVVASGAFSKIIPTLRHTEDRSIGRIFALPCDPTMRRNIAALFPEPPDYTTDRIVARAHSFRPDHTIQSYGRDPTKFGPRPYDGQEL